MQQTDSEIPTSVMDDRKMLLRKSQQKPFRRWLKSTEHVCKVFMALSTLDLSTITIHIEWISKPGKCWANITCAKGKTQETNICEFNETILRLPLTAKHYLTWNVWGSRYYCSSSQKVQAYESSSNADFKTHVLHVHTLASSQRKANRKIISFNKLFSQTSKRYRKRVFRPISSLSTINWNVRKRRSIR